MTWLHEKGDPRSIRRARTAMKRHHCGNYLCQRVILPGDRYMLLVELPGGEAGYADAAGHPVQMKVCAKCHAQCEPVKAEELGESESARSIIESVAAEWADDFSFATPSDLAASLLKALDGAE